MSPACRSALILATALLVQGCKCVPEPDPSNTNTNTNTDPPVTGHSGHTGSTAKPCAVPEVEPNNTVDQATVLPLEQLGCGVIAEPGDIDVFVADVEEEGWVSIATAARAIGSFADMQLVIEPPDGSAVARADDDATTDASLLFPGTVGRWEIQVAEQNFSGGDEYFYQVAISSAKAPLEWTATEVEPNDNLANAMAVSHGDVIYGDMDANLDGDWYRVDVPPGKHTLIADIDAYSFGSAGDFVIYLSDAESNLLPMGCNPTFNCPVFGEPLDPGIRDPFLEWESDGNESLFVKVSEEDFHWGRHTWYVISFSLVGT